MKNKFDKEIIVGLLIFIFLMILSILMIFRRESMLEHGEGQILETEEHLMEEDDLAEEDEFADEKDFAEEEDAALNENKEEEFQYANVPDNITMDAQAEAVEIKAGEFFKPVSLKEYQGEEINQLEEIFFYWNDYQLDAVDDLIHLPRVRTLTKSLHDSNGFYYYGDLNSAGKPEGKGLAVYADDAYYCGEWKNGKRSGKGMWVQIFPDKLGVVNGVSAVEEHSYNGEWENNYPNGEGQEHISYLFDEMFETKGADTYITNVIGNFKDGYYDGELYIMTANEEQQQLDWETTAKKGQFRYMGNEVSTTGKRRVWEKMSNEASQEEYYWMLPAENRNHGIFGLKKK